MTDRRQSREQAIREIDAEIRRLRRTAEALISVMDDNAGSLSQNPVVVVHVGMLLEVGADLKRKLRILD